MRYVAAIPLALSAIVGFWFTTVAPARAEQLAVPGGIWQPLPGRPPADSGKAMLPAPDASAARDEPEACVRGLPCGTRLLGTVHKNGAVELQVPAFRW